MDMVAGQSKSGSNQIQRANTDVCLFTHLLQSRRCLKLLLDESSFVRTEVSVIGPTDPAHDRLLRVLLWS